MKKKIRPQYFGKLQELSDFDWAIVVLVTALILFSLTGANAEAEDGSLKGSHDSSLTEARDQIIDSIIDSSQNLNLNLAMNSDLRQPFQAPVSVSNSRLSHITSLSSKADLVKKFRALADRQTEELSNIDDRIKKYLKESTDITLNTQDLKGADRKFKVLSESLSQLNQAHLERKERQDFYNRFALSIDSQWSGQPLNAFLSGQCLDMSQLELTSDKGSSKLGVFLVYLSVAIREVADPNEDVANFIEDYSNYSTVLNPKSPVEFISVRSYTSGALTYTARTVDKDKLSDQVSKRLDALEVKHRQPKKSKLIEGPQELRMKNFEPSFSVAPKQNGTNPEL